ncbi:sugar-binding transcriptional regulator [Cereibacter sp. SYSU M97828]|nr:sugar-binding transcriptional regulator [Cereibacter flavus]
MKIETDPLDAAARAGWLYYAAGMTQDQIAQAMGISRQRAQRLVSRAMAEGLIRVRLEHPLGSCLELEARLRERFGLLECRVAPTIGDNAARAIAPAAATLFEAVLARPEPQVIGVGTGRALTAMAAELQAVPCDRHRLVSLIGNIAEDGSASRFDVILRLAAKLGAPHYPMTTPVISDSVEERDAFLALAPVRSVRTLGEQATAIFLGVGQMSDDAPLYLDGFISRSELAEVQAQGAVGEVAGRMFDERGSYLRSHIHDRMTSVPVVPGLPRLAVGIAAGRNKVVPIRAALRGRILNAIVTDEETADALLS